MAGATTIRKLAWSSRTYPKVVIIEPERAQPVAVTGDADYARRMGVQDLAHDEVGEQEVAQVVDGQLALEPFRRHRPLGGHDPGIVHEDIDLGHAAPCVNRLSRLTHGNQRHEIQLEGANLDSRVLV